MAPARGAPPAAPSRGGGEPAPGCPARSGEQERPLSVVIDASALLDAALGRGQSQWGRLLSAAHRAGRDVVAPELLWSESVSILHEAAWRRRLEGAALEEALALVMEAPVVTKRPRGLRSRAWAIADRMGWAKTYDAEYCALAELLGCELVTGDGRLRAAGSRLGYVFTPGEMVERL